MLAKIRSQDSIWYNENLGDSYDGMGCCFHDRRNVRVAGGSRAGLGISRLVRLQHGRFRQTFPVRALRRMQGGFERGGNPHRETRVQGSRMSSQFGVRNLLIATGVAAACMLLLVYTIRNQDSSLAFAVTVCLAMVASVFLLFALAFVLLIPWSVVHDFARESTEPAVSPFATDRLPDQQIAPKDIEPTR
jgi:hypothetical protein